jgi:hypothetical protein
MTLLEACQGMLEKKEITRAYKEWHDKDAKNNICGW